MVCNISAPRLKIYKGIGSIVIGMLLMVSSTLTFAKPTSSASGLSSLISIAISNNPGIAATKSQSDAAAAKISAAPFLPDPEFMVEWMDNPLESSMESEARGIEYSLSQMIPLPGKLGAALERQKADADTAREVYEMKISDIKKDVALIYYGIASMDARLAIESKKQKQLEAMGAVIAARYTNGKATLSEYIRTNNMKAMAKTEILGMEADRARMVAELTTMLGGPIPPDTMFVYDLAPLKNLPSENEILANAFKSFPELRMKQAMERRMAAEANQMRLDILPDIMLRGSLNSMNNGDKTYSLGFSISLPLNFSSKQIPLANAAGLMSEATSKERQDTENRITQEIHARYIALTKANEALALYQSTIKNGSQQAFEVALKDYQINRVSFNELIDTFRALFDTLAEMEKAKQLLIEERVYLDFYALNSLKWEGKS